MYAYHSWLAIYDIAIMNYYRIVIINIKAPKINVYLQYLQWNNCKHFVSK